MATETAANQSAAVYQSIQDGDEDGQDESNETDPTSNALAVTISTNPIEVLGQVAVQPAGGLALVSGWLLESTGDPGSSTIRLVDPRSGIIVAAVNIGDGRTGGDITDFGRAAVQLLDGETFALVIDPATLAEIDRLPVDSSSRGICFDGDVLITSDRSNRLTIIDDAGSTIGQLELSDPEGRLPRRLTGIDRLACNAEVIVATILASHLLVAIDRQTGSVLAVADLAHLVPSTISSPDEVEHGLSAVAIDNTGTRIYVTGRGWDRIQVLELEQT